ncbi:MAG: hypothetical protein ABI896_07465 [Actinomycetota bacterium]
MLRSTPIRIAGALACLALGLGLSACGGGGSSKDSAPPATTGTTGSTGTTSTGTGSTETETTGTSDKGGATKPGAKLGLGQTAHVKFKPLSAPPTSKKTYRLDVTVLKIEKGKISDFKNVDLDAKQKKSTPFYVSVKISNPDGDIPVKNDDPDIRFDGIDDRGQEQGSLTFFGTFERCDDASAPNPFSSGKSYESCLAYLMPGGGSIQQINWSGADEYVSNPISWR